MLFLAGASGGRRTDRLRKTLVISLILHVCVLVLIAGVRFKKNVERPLSAVQVSLITAPMQETKPEPRVEKAKPVSKPVQPAPIPVPPKPVQPPPVQTKPAPVPAKPAPVQPKPEPVQAKPAPPSPPPPQIASTPVAPVPSSVQTMVPVQPAPTLMEAGPTAPMLKAPQPIVPAVKSSSAVPIRSKREVMEDLLKDIELPPNAPQFGDLAPSKPAETKRPIQAKYERPQERAPSEIDQMLKKLKVPDMTLPPVEMPKEQAKPMPVPPKVAPSLAEEVNRQLKELKPIQAPPAVKLPEPVRESKPMFEKPPAQQQVQQQPPPVTASAPKSQKVPETKLKVLSGSSQGSNAYLALVQRTINEKWTAPPVDISGTALTVVIKFHLSRNGVISGVEFKQQSGNGWYDDAGRRAVLSVDRLPPFPPQITEPSYDIYFTFAVGEGAG
jgi:colicin import membrane protein